VSTFFIPSPAEGVWYLGPLPLRGYALCIIAGIVAAVWIGERRWLARGGSQGEVTDIALWAVPFGVVGGRLYHVMTDHDLYFGDGRSPINALYVWRGGLGIWGAIALGGVGVWIGAKRKGIRVPPMLDALAPGVLIAQAMGRWGNWFNQELFGRPSTQPWALKIAPENRPPGYEQYSTFQPTFLYESIWDVAAFFFVIWADRRFKLGHGRVLALYVMAYTAGRGWIETLRIDNVEYQHVLGLRLNVWTSIVLFILASIYFVVVGRRRPGRESEVYTEQRLAADRALAAVESDAAASDADAPAEGADVAEGGSGAKQEPEPDPPVDPDRTGDPEPEPSAGRGASDKPKASAKPQASARPRASAKPKTKPTSKAKSTPAPAAEPSAEPAQATEPGRDSAD
jgi:prolipoprotein diacylglyceryl transferase